MDAQALRGRVRIGDVTFTPGTTRAIASDLRRSASPLAQQNSRQLQALARDAEQMEKLS